MKEEIEALRQAQKKREEEELAKVRAAEEAERLRLEKIRLEQEKKERKKQKEKVYSVNMLYVGIHVFCISAMFRKKERG